MTRITYCLFFQSTLCFGKSVQALHLFADATLQLSDLLWCAGNTWNPPFECGISNLASCYAILEFKLLNCRKEIDGLDFMACSTFDPELVNRKDGSIDLVILGTHLGGSLQLCNLTEHSVSYGNNALQQAERPVNHRQNRFLPSLLLVAVASRVHRLQLWHDDFKNRASVSARLYEGRMIL